MIEIAQLNDSQIPAVKEMMREYVSWAYALEGSDGAPTFEGVGDELEHLPGIFAPPSARLLIAEMDGRVIGSVALKQIDHNTCELKRLYVRPEARGHNAGAQLVARLLDEARSIGYRRMILDSHKAMSAAHAIYRKAGFQDTTPPDGFPEWLAPLVVFMELDLRS